LVKLAALALLAFVACGRPGKVESKEAAVNERAGLVTMGGKPVVLLGAALATGDVAPDFTAVGNDMQSVKLSQFKGKVVVVSAVPSLDTPTCNIETRRFNAEAAGLGPDVQIVTVSMDLPFAQKRWCGQAGVERVLTVSDYRTAEFGQAYGVLIKDLRLLARAVFVVDRQGVIRYIQLVNEVGSEPDYAPILEAVRKLS